MRCKDNNQKGSALLSILAALALLTVIIFLILNYSVNEQRYSRMRSSLDTALWNGRGTSLLISQRLQSLELKLDSHGIKGAIADLETAYTVEKSSGEGIRIETEPTSPGPKQRIIRELKARYYSDQVFIYNGDYAITVGRGETKEIVGHITVDGNVTINVEGKLIWHASSDRPLLECRQLQIISNATGEITFKKRLHFNTETASFMAQAIPSDLKDFIKVNNAPLVYPNIEKIETLLADPAKSIRPEPKLINKVKIINEALPEKELLEQRDGYEPHWKIRRQNIGRIYFSPPVSDGIVDPGSCLDTDGYPPGFEIKDGSLTLRTSSIKLNLKTEDCNTVNQFSYGLPGNIASSIHREIISVSLGSTKLEEGRDIEIDRQARKIIFYDPPFKTLISRGNGERTTFRTPSDFNSKNPVFCGTRRIDNFKYDHGQITFPFTPQNHEEIAFYKEIPDLYISKGRLFPSIKAYIDKEVEVLEIDLSDRKWASDSIILFNTPILLKGEPRTKLTIICGDDIYLDNIPSGKGLEIYCQRVWSINNEALKLNDVFLYSSGDEILTIQGKLNNFSIQGTLVLAGEKSAHFNRKQIYEFSSQLLELKESSLLKECQTLPMVMRK